MICKNCGTENNENANFCKNCGEKLESDQTENSRTKKKQRFGTKKERIAGIVVALVLAAIFIGDVIWLKIVYPKMNLLGSSGIGGAQIEPQYMKVAEQCVESIITGNLDEFMELLSDEYYSGTKELIDYVLSDGFQSYSEEMQDEFEGYEDMHFIYNGISSEEVKGEALESLKEIYREGDCEISGARTVEVEVKECRSGASTTMKVPVVKISGTWYLNLESWGEEKEE